MCCLNEAVWLHFGRDYHQPEVSQVCAAQCACAKWPPLRDVPHPHTAQTQRLSACTLTLRSKSKSITATRVVCVAIVVGKDGRGACAAAARTIAALGVVAWASGTWDPACRHSCSSSYRSSVVARPPPSVPAVLSTRSLSLTAEYAP